MKLNVAQSSIILMSVYFGPMVILGLWNNEWALTINALFGSAIGVLCLILSVINLLRKQLVWSSIVFLISFFQPISYLIFYTIPNVNILLIHRLTGISFALIFFAVLKKDYGTLKRAELSRNQVLRGEIQS